MATTFAKRIEKAAADFPGAFTLAWVQYHAEDRTVSVRMLAPEVMKQFRGSVKFGTGRSDKLVTGRSNCNLYSLFLLTSSRHKGYFIFQVRSRPRYRR